MGKASNARKATERALINRGTGPLGEIASCHANMDEAISLGRQKAGVLGGMCSDCLFANFLPAFR